MRSKHGWFDLKKTDHVKCFGNSMYPILHNGDVIYYKKTPFESIKINDIVVIKSKKTYITHRVVYPTGNYLVTKGDNNFSIDPICYPHSVIGKVYKISRHNQTFYTDAIYLVQSTFYLQEITKLTKLLNKAKVPHVFLKGLLLYLIFTQTHPRRKYLDYDVLVRFEDYDRVHSILTKLGYEKKEDYISPLHEKIIDKPIETTYIKSSRQFSVAADVHFEPVFMMTQIGKLDELYPQAYINKLNKQFMTETQVKTINNIRYNILSLPNLIIYLALHFFHHNFKGIYRLELLDTIIRSISSKTQREVWEKVTADIQQYELKNYIFGTFLLLKKYFKTPVPAVVFKKLRPEEKHINYIEKYVKKTSIFEGNSRMVEGVTLFKNLYYLSYRNPFLKILVFFRPAVVFIILWLTNMVIIRRLRAAYKTSATLLHITRQ